jgi:acetyl-CoA carboxylase, biotin carboxylase subunit
VPPYYDSLIGKVIVWDETREAAIGRALRALAAAPQGGLFTRIRDAFKEGLN